jgi:hypothetical protein
VRRARVRSSLRKRLRNQKSDRKALLPGVWVAVGLVSRPRVRADTPILAANRAPLTIS